MALNRWIKNVLICTSAQIGSLKDGVHEQYFPDDNLITVVNKRIVFADVDSNECNMHIAGENAYPMVVIWWKK